VTNQQILQLIGCHVREARLKSSLTQECLAELVGIHWKTISNIERGNYPIAVTTFARICQYLETSPNRLLEGMKPPDAARTNRIKRALARRRTPQKANRGGTRA
jgi:DNA-binding XRE family transcriptional regulator